MYGIYAHIEVMAQSQVTPHLAGLTLFHEQYTCTVCLKLFTHQTTNHQPTPNLTTLRGWGASTIHGLDGMMAGCGQRSGRTGTWKQPSMPDVVLHHVLQPFFCFVVRFTPARARSNHKLQQHSVTGLGKIWVYKIQNNSSKFCKKRLSAIPPMGLKTCKQKIPYAISLLQFDFLGTITFPPHQPSSLSAAGNIKKSTPAGQCGIRFVQMLWTKGDWKSGCDGGAEGCGGPCRVGPRWQWPPGCAAGTT